MSKAFTGNYFEDFFIGQKIRHPTPRTIHGGDLSSYIAMYGDRRPLHSSTEFAKSLGYQREVVHDLLAFHVVFGKTVGQVSLNAVANLGYADVRFLAPCYPGDTLRAETEVIGLRETSNGKAGVVYVTTQGFNQRDQPVLTFNRWVMVNKREPGKMQGVKEVPVLPEQVAAADLPVPEALSLDRFSALKWATGGDAFYEDYEVGEVIHHVDGMTIDHADHTMATRLYQNTAKVHFNQHQMADSRFGQRLVYGGHIISIAHSLAINGLENVLAIAAWNSGAHANPTFAGDTVYASTEILDAQLIPGRDDLGALRMRLMAYKNVDPQAEEVPRLIEVEGKSKYDPRVVLDLDYWGLVPSRTVLD